MQSPYMEPLERGQAFRCSSQERVCSRDWSPPAS
jgi:hypothetical protein